MTDSDTIKCFYQKPTESGDLADKELNIYKDNLLVTLVKNGQDFIDFGPIDLVERLFESKKNDLEFREYLNNFDSNIKQAVEKKLTGILSRLDAQTHRYGMGVEENEKTRYSARHLEQTIEDFWNDVDQAIQVCKLDKDKLRKLYTEGTEQMAKGKYVEWRENIYHEIRPLYIQLRKKGYTSHDLTS